MNSKDNYLIPYHVILDKSMKYAVYQILKNIYNQSSHLPGDHYFVINFSLNNNKNDIDSNLASRYKDNMTIILQHQFNIISINEEYFIISLAFSGKYCNLKIYFDSLLLFSDPYAQFSLQFDDKTQSSHDLNQTSDGNIHDEENRVSNFDDNNIENNNENIISLDSFRKNKLKNK